MAAVLLPLLNDVAVILVAAWFVSRTAWFDEALPGRVPARAQARIALAAGLMGAYGTFSGVAAHGSLATIRCVGPLAGGLLGGPWPGLASGLLASLHAVLAGGDAALAPGILATMAAGVAGGLFHHATTRRTGVHLRPTGAALFAVLVQMLHQALVLAMVRPFPAAWTLVDDLGLSLFLANGLGAGLIFKLISVRGQERLLRQQRDQFLGQKQKIEGELGVAREIQRGMVPSMYPKPPSWPGARIFAQLRSAREVGGDFYDFFDDEAGRLVFIIGDVSDKGVPAALFMAETRTLIRGMARTGLAPHELLGRVNRELEEGNALNMFVTLFCARLDLATGELVFSNAGHNPPLILGPGGSARWLRLPPGLVLGAVPGAAYGTGSLTLARGEVVLAYTDGVTEAMDLQGRMFTEGRLLESARALAGASPQELVDGLDAAVRAFALGAVQSDDVALLAVEYTGPS